jgi:hypothetical protein
VDAVLAATLDKLEFSSVHNSPKALLYVSFRALGEALQSGNMKAVQSAWHALMQAVQNAPPGQTFPRTSGATLAHLAEAMRLLRESVQNGDLAGAQQAYATIRQILRDVRAGTPQDLFHNALRLLGEALQSGNIRAIQSAWRGLAQVMQTESLSQLASGATLVQLAEAMRLLQRFMQNGDLAGAQQAYATIRQLLWGTRSGTLQDSLQASFLALGEALQAGNMRAAQSAVSAMAQVMRAASPEQLNRFTEGVKPALFAMAIRALQESVQNGNLVGAQQAYVAIRQLLRNAGSSTPQQAPEDIQYNGCHPQDRWTRSDVPIYRAARNNMSTPIITGVGPAERVAAEGVKLRGELQQPISSVHADSVPAAALDSIEFTPIRATPQSLLYDSFRALGEALQSGNMKTAQSAWRALAQVMQTASLGQASQIAADVTLSHLAEAVLTLQQSVQSGDISGAQQAYATLRRLLRNAPSGTPQHLSGESTANDSDELATPRTGKQPSALQAYWLAQMDADDTNAAAVSRQPHSVRGEDYDLYLLLAANRLPVSRAEQDEAEDAGTRSSPRSRSLLWYVGINVAALLFCLITGLFQFTVESAIPLLIVLGVINALALVLIRFSPKS